MIEHSTALNVFEEHFQCLEKKPIDAKINNRQLYAKPLSCAQWHELEKLTGMDHSIRLVQLSVVYEDGTPIFLPQDIYRLETRVDGAVIKALANMAFEKIIDGVNDLKNGFRHPTDSEPSSTSPSPSA